jgi:hypothetical protein
VGVVDEVTVAVKLTPAPKIDGLGCAVKLVCVVSAKFAVTVAGAFTVTVCGLVAPLRAPLKPTNWYPELADAEIASWFPGGTYNVAGEMVPPAAGLTAVVSK